MSVGVPAVPGRGFRSFKTTAKWVRKLALFAVAGYFIPEVLVFYLCCGVLDVMRNTRRTFSTIDRYFTGNGIFTWLLSPFNLFMDLISLPYWNKGVYKLADLPKPYQDEIQNVLDNALKNDLVGKLEAKMGDQKRGMIFFKWYGKNISTSVDIPEFHQQYKYIRTIGVSVFNKKQSTGKHYGPLRVTLRVLYNINNIASKDAYIKVGNQVNHWQDNKLFIFDDTLQHQSCNETDAVRYCMFIDILRPGLFPRLNSTILTGIRWLMAPFNAIFYQHWTFIK
ncbi:MAG: aspartyl/asparaginyl beta-hydroxylase domain-containing protein [Planctomycetes bacterium]|nr:aspartyl/asparaginyl beta-hydroxylase domain-containing protein [Planctomycetota bacterium]